MNAFHHTSYARQVIFGAGELAGLAGVLDQFSMGRAMLFTSGSYIRNGTAERVQRLLDHRLVALFDAVRPHVPDDTVEAALTLAEQEEIDGIISLGGGSTIGTAKAVSVRLEARRSGQPARARHVADQPLIPVIAIPTTYSGSEMTPIYGITHADEGRKITVTDGKVAPKVVLYDPELTLDLPPELTGATGINALAHCVEGLYSPTRSPLTTAAALAGIEHIARALPRCVKQGDDLDARTAMLTGAYLAGTVVANARAVLHHGICHVLGGTAGVPHGIANSIMLPHALRFNLPASAAELAAAARPLGVDSTGLAVEDAARAAADAVAELIRSIDMPQRLRDAGVAEVELPRLAALALKSSAVRANPVPVDAARVESLLRAAW